MENEILNIFIKLIEEDKISYAIENRCDTIDYPITINSAPNMKVIDIFNQNFFDKYELTLLTNATVYALESNDNSFISTIHKHIDRLKMFIKSDNLFRLKITEYAIKNITSKLHKKSNMVSFIKEFNDDIISKNKDLFKSIKDNYVDIYIITSYYRKVLLDFLERNKQYLPDQEASLDEFLFTNRLDSFFLYENKLFDSSSIKDFKKIIIRLILGDNYVSTELDLQYYDSDDCLNNIDHISNDFIEDVYIEYTKIINNHLKNCISNNIYSLPKNEQIRYEMYFRFFNFSKSGYYKTIDIKTIDEDENKRLELKKINPLYKLDLNE